MRVATSGITPEVADHCGGAVVRVAAGEVGPRRRAPDTSPAATRTTAPPQWSADSGVMPDVATRTTVPSNPVVGDEEVGPSRDDEQRLVRVVDLADGVDDLVGRRGRDDRARQGRRPASS